MENEKKMPNGKLKVLTSKAGNKYVNGICYPEEGKGGYFLSITKKTNPRDEYEYTVWMEPMPEKGTSTYTPTQDTADIPF